MLPGHRGANHLNLTLAGNYRPGVRVNLERALRMGSRLDGHLVQGHVDGLGRLESVMERGAEHHLHFSIPQDVARVTIPRGSLTINGVSLTVADGPTDEPSEVGAEPRSRVGIAVIPHTWEQTNLSELRSGDPVNLEADLIGKYVGSMVAPYRPGVATTPPDSSPRD